jgi:hypothetical protein
MKIIPLTTALVLAALAPAALAFVDAKCLIIENREHNGYNVKDIIYPYDFEGRPNMLRGQFEICKASLLSWRHRLKECDDTSARLMELLKMVSPRSMLFFLLGGFWRGFCRSVCGCCCCCGCGCGGLYILTVPLPWAYGVSTYGVFAKMVLERSGGADDWCSARSVSMKWSRR